MEQAQWHGLFKVGGVAFVVAGILYVALLGMFVASGGGPADAAGLLQKVSENAFLIQSVGAMFLAMYLCLMVAFPALFIALIRVNIAGPFVAVVLALTALVFDTFSSLLVYTLPSFARSAVSAESALQPAYQVTAEMVYSYIWKVETPAHVAFVSLAILIFGLVMRKSTFGKPAAYTGIVVGGIGIVAALFGFFPISVTWPIWFIPVGYKLYRSKRLT